MAMRAKLTALLGAVLAGFFLLIGGAAPASAHAGHDHAQNVTIQAPAPIPVSIEAIFATEPDEGKGPAHNDGSQIDVTTSPGKLPVPVHQGNCCCGSIACHAGVEASTPMTLIPYRLAGKIEPPPARGMAKADQGGIERPPRAALPL